MNLQGSILGNKVKPLDMGGGKMTQVFGSIFKTQYF